MLNSHRRLVDSRVPTKACDDFKKISYSMDNKDISRRNLIAGGMAVALSLSLIAAATSAEQASEANSILLAEEAKQLRSSEIQNLIVGNTLEDVLQDGDEYSLYLEPQGAAYLRMHDGREEIGRWEFIKNGLIKSRFPSAAGNNELTMACLKGRSVNEFFNIADHGKRWGRFTCRDRRFKWTGEIHFKMNDEAAPCLGNQA